MSKFPKKALGKWNRFNQIEKGFIIYCIILIISLFGLPIIQYKPLDISQNIMNFYIRDHSMIKILILLIVMLVFLLAWNLSFRFKRLINILVGFKENDALINFGILLVITMQLLSIGEVVNLIRDNLSSYSINLTYGYYIIGFVLLIGLVWNLFIAMNISKNKKKSQIVNIISDFNEESPDEKIKGLFE